MNMSRFFSGAMLAALATVGAVAVHAQAPSGASGEQPLGGPAVPGVCLLSREAIFANAAAGKAAASRLAELTRTAQAEIDQQRTALEAEAKALAGQANDAQAQQRREALGQRWQALQSRAAHNSREIEATRAKALDRIATEAQPLIAQAYGQRKCGLLLDRNVAMGGNFANDLTAEVVRALDAKLKAFEFDRERLPEQQGSSGKS